MKNSIKIIMLFLPLFSYAAIPNGGVASAIGGDDANNAIIVNTKGVFYLATADDPLDWKLIGNVSGVTSINSIAVPENDSSNFLAGSNLGMVLGSLETNKLTKIPRYDGVHAIGIMQNKYYVRSDDAGPGNYFEYTPLDDMQHWERVHADDVVSVYPNKVGAILRIYVIDSMKTSFEFVSVNDKDILSQHNVTNPCGTDDIPGILPSDNDFFVLCGVGSTAQMMKYNPQTLSWSDLGAFNHADTATKGVHYSYAKVSGFELKNKTIPSSIVVVEDVDNIGVVGVRQYFENGIVSSFITTNSNVTDNSNSLPGSGVSVWSSNGLGYGYAMFIDATSKSSKLFYVELGQNAAIKGHYFWK